MLWKKTISKLYRTIRNYLQYSSNYEYKPDEQTQC